MSAVVAVAALALLGSIGADSASAAKGGLEFRQCGREGHEAFECAKMTVPLKLPTGRPREARPNRPGKRKRIRIHVERLKSSRNHDGALLALAGGPGQAATDFAPQFAEELAPVYEGNQQLVAIDQRGTGKSGFLDCDGLEVDGRGVVALRRCSNQLGPRARWYRTADSVADIQKLRRKLGVEQLSIYGVSYGTVVAGQYARTYPNRVRSLILDSVFSGWDPLMRPSLAASARVLEAFCADGECAEITDDPVGDTASLVQRSESGLQTRVVDPDRSFRKVRQPIKSGGLFDALFATDLNAALRAMWPAALAAADGGDLAPVGRLIKVAGGSEGRAADEDRELSTVLNIATNCVDTPNPWRTRISTPLRKRATAELAESTPPETFGPFNAAAAYAGGIANNCFGWRFGPQRGALTDRSLPDVPALLLEGEVDLRTPISTMRQVGDELPRSQETIIANQGHSTLSTECGAASLAAWVAGGPVPPRCEEPIQIPNEPVPERSLDDYSAPTQPERTFDAVRDTLFTDAITFANVLQFSGQQVGGGVRSGGMRIRPGAEFVIALRGYSLVPGVKVDGRMTLARGAADGRFEVRGRAASHGTLRLVDGELSGRLGDQRFERTLGAEERQRLRETADAEAEPTPAAIP
jgi:pimeloyl-ACP methyl ester carboxylesterase